MKDYKVICSISSERYNEKVIYQLRESKRFDGKQLYEIYDVYTKERNGIDCENFRVSYNSRNTAIDSIQSIAGKYFSADFLAMIKD